jgi:hypothetical protein
MRGILRRKFIRQAYKGGATKRQAMAAYRKQQAAWESA